MTEVNSNSSKRQSKYFNNYISLVLKNICEKSGITKEAKTQLNSCLIILARNISINSRQITINNKKKTVSKNEITTALKLVLIDDLYIKSIEEGEKAIYNYVVNKKKAKSSRQQKAQIIFPVALCEKFLRNFGNSKLMITKDSSIFLASILEYICAQILECVRDNICNLKRVRFKSSDIDYAIKNDKELLYLFNKYDIEFLKGSIIPFIHPELQKKKKYIIDKTKPKTKRRFKSGTVAIRDVKKQQKSGYELAICHRPFNALIKNIFNKLDKKDIKITKKVYLILQYILEKEIVELLFKANLISIHCGRVKLCDSDIILANNINKNIVNIKNYYKKEKAEKVENEEVKDEEKVENEEVKDEEKVEEKVEVEVED